MARDLRIADLRDHAGEQVTLSGWVDVLRDQKQVQFLVVRDETGRVQVVNERAERPDIAEILSGLSVDSVVKVTGLVVIEPRVKLGGLEVRCERVEVLSLAEEAPINAASSLEKRMDWRFIDLRSARNQLTFRVEAEISDAFRQFCRSKDFVEINSPKLMASASESTAELFEVRYFDRKAYLAQSPQFYKQMGIASGFPGVFETGPVFRANPSFTSRHDTEFTSLDVEMGFVDSHEDVMSFEERLLAYALERVADRYGAEIEAELGGAVVPPRLPFPRIPHHEALRIVEASGYHIPRSDGDLDPEAERRLAAHVAEHLDHEFVFVTDYPASLRPFYHMRHSSDPGLTKSFDLIWKGLEITTGAQREHRPDELVAQIREKGFDPSAIQFYVNFFRFGCPPHGGFGLGLTRLVMVLLGAPSVREVTYLYRGPNRLTP